MYDTILVPVDLSSTNTAVFSTIRALTAPAESDLILLHVVETLHDDEPDEMDDFYEELREAAGAKLTEWAEDLVEDGFDVRTQITYGERAPEITRVADDEDVDLIVQRSHTVNRDDDPDTSIGTVSHQVAVFAPCSVLLVRTEKPS